MTNLFDLSGKVALLTGASKGMGMAMAHALAAHGAKVMVSSRKAEACAAAAASINEMQGANQAAAFACNVGYKDQVAALVTETRRLWGGIDILVGNAGVNLALGPMVEIADAAYDKTMSTNVKSNLWLAQLAAPDMAARGGGAMIFTSSMGAFIPSTDIGVYNMSKLTLIALVRNLAAELGPRGIRVNAICPGLIRTDFSSLLWEDPKISAQTEARVPLRRLGEPEDIAGAAVFLASRAGAYVNGQALTICGGLQMWS